MRAVLAAVLFGVLGACGGAVEGPEEPSESASVALPTATPVEPPTRAATGPCCVFADGTGEACGCSVPTLFYAEGDVPFWCSATRRACAPASSCSAIVDGHAHLGSCKP